MGGTGRTLAGNKKWNRGRGEEDVQFVLVVVSFHLLTYGPLSDVYGVKVVICVV